MPKTNESGVVVDQNAGVRLGGDTVEIKGPTNLPVWCQFREVIKPIPLRSPSQTKSLWRRGKSTGVGRCISTNHLEKCFAHYLTGARVQTAKHFPAIDTVNRKQHGHPTRKSW